MRPSDLDDPTPVEPDDALLDRVRNRGGAVRRRRRAQRLASTAAGALVLALVVGIALVTVRSDDHATSGPAPTTTTTQPAVTAADLMGAWRPISISGYRGAFTSPPLASVPTLRLSDSGHIGGDDACNSFGATFDVQPDGEFRAVVHARTHVLCPHELPLQQMLGEARRAELRDHHLVLFAADGHQLAEFVPWVVTARIELQSHTMVAGSTMTGRVIIDNETGKVIKAIGCGSLFQVILTNASYQPEVLWNLCAEPLDIPLGVSTYPVVVMGTVNAGVAPLPTLAPGRYEAKLYQSTHVVPDPTPVWVEVVAP
jgi:heat shock protein HslJ